MIHAFLRYDLRTTDPDAARAFYAEAIGLDIPDGMASASSALAAWVLHEQARARGAPPHWLGHVGVDDVEAAAARIVDHGGARLGPTIEARDGAAYATLRDPWGAVLSVRARAPQPAVSPVAWHHLHTTDVDRAWPAYAALFGWTRVDAVDAADPPEGARLFAWDGAGTASGSMANTARAAGVHVHWLYYFPVADLDAALAKVTARGGRPGAAAVLPNGDRIAPCEDPQGAAFGVHEEAR